MAVPLMALRVVGASMAVKRATKKAGKRKTRKRTVQKRKPRKKVKVSGHVRGWPKK